MNDLDIKRGKILYCMPNSKMGSLGSVCGHLLGRRGTSVYILIVANR